MTEFPTFTRFSLIEIAKILELDFVGIVCKKLVLTSIEC